MTPFPAAIAAFFLILFAACPPPPSAHALGGTIAVVYGSATTICTITAQPPVQQIQCWSNGRLLPPILPNTSFDAVAGGRDTICGLRSGGFSLLCWNTTFSPKRIYNNASAPLTWLTIGATQICALRNGSSADNAICWRQNSASSSHIPKNLQFRVISSGLLFSCGVNVENRVLCWGDDAISNSIQSELQNFSMLNIHVGDKFACGINVTGCIVCKGSNDSGQLNTSPFETAHPFSAVAVGTNHGCAIRKSTGGVVCWGGSGNKQFSSKITDKISFESIVAGPDFTCGLTTSNFSIVCWGPGWPNQYYSTGILLPLEKTLPGPCIDTACDCNVYPGSEILCSGNGHICGHCDFATSIPPFLQPAVVVNRSPSRGLRRGLLVFAIVGSIGGIAGIATAIYCLWTGICFGKKKIHNSVQPTMTATAPPPSNSSPPSRSSTLRRQGSRMMRRQRSGTSSKHADKAEEFSFSDLVAATDDFSQENKIGGGSFGVVYRGKLPDGREVAIKRSETSGKAKKFQEKESAFESEVSDFGLSLMGPEDDRDYRPTKAAGTVGYIDPEYYGLNVLTAKSDVYGLGVVLLELLTGKRAIFNGGEPMSIVDYTVPAIMAGEVAGVLDGRVGPPEGSEGDAVELVAYTAMHCVHLEGKDRPTMNDIVTNLERALALCDDSHGSISSGPISIVSD
ncbi:non-specific serine/threonine protein kinase [Salvia divinorum]|uniref:Non-specific serine/threonine protein kinase n=1 Tax=Salvia divinorum TaxID=28513 RepID=A0ABD1GKU9_SALDI